MRCFRLLDGKVTQIVDPGSERLLISGQPGFTDEFEPDGRVRRRMKMPPPIVLERHEFARDGDRISVFVPEKHRLTGDELSMIERAAWPMVTPCAPRKETHQ